MIKKLLIAVLASFLTSAVFAQRIISPVAGNFSNKQTLVLDTSDGAECFYSFTGSDPLTSGFAYDGPILIDAIGRVTVRIAVVFGENHSEEAEVIFNVQENNPYNEDSAESYFIKNVANKGIFTYTEDNPLKIPNSFSYFLGDGEKPQLQGKTLTMDSANVLSRFVSCSVAEGNNLWRFVIFVPGGAVGVLSKQSVPFKIQDWNTFIFEGEKLIYSIDGGEWSASKVPVTLDRSVKHKISWQSVAYEKGNPVHNFVLPVEPKLVSSKNSRGAATFRIDGDVRYRMSVVSSNAAGTNSTNKGLLSSAVFDTFEGDNIRGEAVFELFCDGVSQGLKRAYYDVDRQPPLPPKFNPSNRGFYSRGKVDLQINSERDTQISYSISAPLKISDTDFEVRSPELDKVQTGSFVPYTDTITLLSSSETPVFYKVKAFAKDNAGNTSLMSEYRVIIDEFNYYLDSSSTSVSPDGSRKNPFNSFEQAVGIINQGRFAHFFVKGEFILPAKEILINSNCAFTAVAESKIIIPPQGSILLRGASLEAHNLIIQKERSQAFNSNTKMVTLENATASFYDCEIISLFDESGTAFSALNSVIELNSTGLTGQADSYICAVSGQDSKVFCKNGRVSCVAQTAVNFSVNGGLFECRSSSLRVTAHLGRIAELSGTNSRMTDNEMTGTFEKKVRGVVPVWSDRDTLILEDKNNSSTGF
jgi:hypothetical protein